MSGPGRADLKQPRSLKTDVNEMKMDSRLKYVNFTLPQPPPLKGRGTLRRTLAPWKEVGRGVTFVSMTARELGKNEWKPVSFFYF